MNQSTIRFSGVKRAQSLSDVVASQLVEAILSGRLDFGDALPSERELCKQFEVSRTVIREALRSLAAKGLAATTSGRGMLVTRPNVNGVSETISMFLQTQGHLDYRAIHEVRVPIETQAAGLAALRASAVDLNNLKNLCKAFDAAAEESNNEECVELDCEFHRYLVKITGNDLLGAIVDSIADVLREVRRGRMFLEGVAKNAGAGHRRILQAIVDGNILTARAAMEAHLDDALRVWSDE